MYILPFHPDHLLGLNVVDEEKFFLPEMDDAAVRRSFLIPSLSFSALDGGKVYASYGIIPLSKGRGLVWLLFDKDIGPNRFLKVTKIGSDTLNNLMENGFYRIEAYVQTGYLKAHRLAGLFGFQFEGTMIKLDGIRDYSLYAKVN